MFIIIRKCNLSVLLKNKHCNLTNFTMDIISRKGVQIEHLLHGLGLESCAVKNYLSILLTGPFQKINSNMPTFTRHNSIRKGVQIVRLLPELSLGSCDVEK